MARTKKRTRTAPVAEKQPGRSVASPDPIPGPLDGLDFAFGAAVAGVTAIVYFLTAARDFVLGDTPELMTAALKLGVAHPPGYPLFTVLGHLFSLLPVGALPFRLNLMAVLCGTGAVTFVYFTALRLTGSRAASACAALVLAFTPLFWSWSLVAEVFPLNNFLAAGMIYCALRWQERPERMAFLATAAFLCGLALANHQTVVLLGPAILFLLWRGRRELLARPRMVVGCAIALLLGLLPYAYLPWAAARHPVWNWGDASSWTNFLAVVTRQHFGGGQLINSPKYQGGSPVDRLVALGTSFGLLAGTLIVLGAIQAWRQRRWYLWFSLLAFVFAGPFFAAYANMNLSVPLSRFVLERFFLLSHVILAPLMAFGVMFAGELLAAASSVLRAYGEPLAAALVLLAVLGILIANYARIDQHRNHAARRFAEDIFATLAPGTVLAADGDEVIMPLTYLQDVEGYRPDVAIVVMPLLHSDWYVPQLRRHYPNLVVPFAVYDGRTATMKALIEANPGRTFAADGFAGDDSLNQQYWFYRRGLVDELEPMKRDVNLNELIAENQRLFKLYRPPSPGEIKSNSLEPTILGHYATPAFTVAQQCQQFQYFAQAREWYQRALSFNPGLTVAREALARIP